MTRHDETIKNLCDDLQPVKPLKHPLLRALPWMAVTLAYIASGVFYLGVRPDFSFKLNETGYLFELVMAFTASIAAGIAAIYCSVPDMRGKLWFLSVPASLAGALAIWLCIRLCTEEIHHAHFHGVHCFFEAIVFALLPAAFLTYLVGRGAPTRPLMAAGFVMLSTSLMSWAALRVTCPLDDMGHLLITHILPFVVFGGIAGYAANKLFKW